MNGRGKFKGADGTEFVGEFANDNKVNWLIIIITKLFYSILLLFNLLILIFLKLPIHSKFILINIDL